MTHLLEPRVDRPVQFLWGSSVVVEEADLTGLLQPDVDLPESGPPCEELNPSTYVSDLAGLEEVFARAMNAAARADGADPITQVNIQVQGWREGYGIPAEASGSQYIGWCYLAATPAPSTAESGCLSLADPRAGSDLTAMPGLPWGRPVIIRPVPGCLTVAPGWLIHSIVPIEHTQRAIVAIATCSR